MSDWVENRNRKNPYSLVDMAGDAVAVLDALEIQEAHRKTNFGRGLWWVRY